MSFKYEIDTDRIEDDIVLTLTVSADAVGPTWESHAKVALDAIGQDVQYTMQVNDLDDIEGILSEVKSNANAQAHSPSALVNSLVRIAAIARPHVDLPDDQIVAILSMKQRDYGTGNILAFGLTGLHVRVSDKVARIRNLTDRNVEGVVEPLADAWLDLVGYAVIAHMLYNGVFETPLLEDAVPWEREQFLQMIADVGNTVVQEVIS